MSLESSVSLWDWLSFWLITGGAILAFFGGLSSIMFRRYNHQLVVLTEAHDREEKAANDKAIADADARAAEADARASEANKKAADLDLKAEKLKADNLKLEKEMFGLRGQGDLEHG
jgi:hypothetical protein